MRILSTIEPRVTNEREPPRPPLTMSVAEAAKLLGVGEAAIRAAVRRGELPGVRVGKLIRIMRAPLLEKLGLPEDYEIE